MRTLTVMVLAMLSMGSQATELHIEGGEAWRTLNEWSRQTGLQVLFEFKAVKRRHTGPVYGDLDGLEALATMLDGSELVFQMVNDMTIAVVPRADDQLTRAQLAKIDGNTEWFETGRFVWCTPERYTLTLGDYRQFSYSGRKWCELNETDTGRDHGLSAGLAYGDPATQTGDADLQSFQDQSDEGNGRD